MSLMQVMATPLKSHSTNMDTPDELSDYEKDIIELHHQDHEFETQQLIGPTDEWYDDYSDYLSHNY